MSEAKENNPAPQAKPAADAANKNLAPKKTSGSFSGGIFSGSLFHWLVVGALLGLPWWLPQYQTRLVQWGLISHDDGMADNSNYEQQKSLDINALIEANDRFNEKLAELSQDQQDLSRAIEAKETTPPPILNQQAVVERDASVVMLIKLTMIYQRILAGEQYQADLASARLWFNEFKTKLELSDALDEAWQDDFDKLASLPAKIPTEAALIREFEARAATIQSDLLAEGPSDESWWQLLQREASRLIRLRSTKPDENGEIMSPVAKAEKLLQLPTGDGLQKAANTLRPMVNQSQSLAIWLAKYDERQLALDVVETMESRALSLWHHTGE